MNLKTLSILILSASMLAGCYPKGPEYTDDYDLVLTNYSKEYDFGGQKTYAIPDSIVKVTGDAIDNPGDITYVGSIIADPILNAIRKNMDSRGYQQVSKDSADVIILVAGWEVTNVSVYYNWGYWGGYYPGYSPGWGWGYPYYPTYPVTTSYKTGSIMIQWTDPQLIENLVEVEWLSIFNGLAEGGTTNIISRATRAVDQAFIQSPYIKSN
jgi:Domain of unknown function (DUF4136)